MASSLTLKGGRELERALRDLSDKAAGRLGINATRAGSRVIVNSAKNKVPVRTGALRESLRVFDDNELNRSSRSQRAAGAGTRLFYGRFVEFGTAHVPARSFLRAAQDESAQAALDKLAENLGAGIERETAKYKGR